MQGLLVVRESFDLCLRHKTLKPLRESELGLLVNARLEFNKAVEMASGNIAEELGHFQIL
jgi:hypothetical protein